MKLSSSLDDFEKIKIELNSINQQLSSLIGSDTRKSFGNAIREVLIVSSISRKARKIFDKLFRGHKKDKSDVLALEVKVLHETLQARSNYLAESQHNQMLNMLSETNVSKDPKGFFNAAACVFSYAKSNSKWKLKNEDALVQVYEKVVTYVEGKANEIDGYDRFLQFMGNVLPSTQGQITIIVGEASYTVDRTKILISSGLVNKMIRGAFKESGQSVITLNGVDNESFQYFIQFVKTRNAAVLDMLELDQLIKLNACCSMLMADFKMRCAIIAKINEKVDDVTIGYTIDHSVELVIQDSDLSEDAMTLLGDPVVQQETGLLDLRGIDGLSNDNLKHLLSNYSNTQTLIIKYDPNITRSGWLALSNVGRVTNLHLDFEGVVSASKESFIALEEVATKHREARSKFSIHVENGGGLEVATLLEMADTVPQSIASLDLTSSEIKDIHLSSVLENLCDLEVLTLDRCKRILGSNFLTTIKSSCPNIRELSLSHSARVKEDVLIDLFESTRYLMKLNLGWHHYLTDATVQQLSKKCKHLNAVDFTNLKNITDKALKKLVKKCKKLTDVKLDFCKSLTNESLVELKDHAIGMERLSIFRAFQMRGRLPLEAIDSLMESRSGSFELVINESCPEISSLIAKASKYPMVTIKAVAV